MPATRAHAPSASAAWRRYAVVYAFVLTAAGRPRSPGPWDVSTLRRSAFSMPLVTLIPPQESLSIHFASPFAKDIPDWYPVSGMHHPTKLDNGGKRGPQSYSTAQRLTI